MSPFPAVFVTGTDTEVGKTIVGAALAAGFHAAGLPVRALKPLASGDRYPGEDASTLAAAANHAPLVHKCFVTPAAPPRAARQEGEVIERDEVLQWIRDHQRDDAALIVEGVGGWRAPLAHDWQVRDLAIALQLPVVVVAANRLGVLSHTALTVESIRASGLSVQGIVLNDAFDVAPELAAWNRDDLREQLPNETIVSMRRLTLPDDLPRMGGWLLRRLGILEDKR